MSALDQLREIALKVGEDIRSASEQLRELIAHIEKSFQPTKDAIEFLEKESENEAVSGDLIEPREFERSERNTPYKPKWKPFMRDKRLTIKRCRSCCRDKIHKKHQKSSFAMSIPKLDKRRYNIDEIAYCMRSRGYHTIRFFSRKEKENGRKQIER